MKQCVITFRSVTPAQRGKEVLSRKGIDSVLQRTPKWMEQQGCGYCLYVECEGLEEAVEDLRVGGILYRKVYHCLQQGKVEELEL